MQACKFCSVPHLKFSETSQFESEMDDLYENKEKFS